MYLEANKPTSPVKFTWQQQGMPAIQEFTVLDPITRMVRIYPDCLEEIDLIGSYNKTLNL